MLHKGASWWKWKQKKDWYLSHNIYPIHKRKDWHQLAKLATDKHTVMVSLLLGQLSEFETTYFISSVVNQILVNLLVTLATQYIY